MKKMIVAIASAAFLCAYGALKDADGNAVTAETPFGDVDGETWTVGDLLRRAGASLLDDGPRVERPAGRRAGARQLREREERGAHEARDAAGRTLHRHEHGPVREEG